ISSVCDKQGGTRAPAWIRRREDRLLPAAACLTCDVRAILSLSAAIRRRRFPILCDVDGIARRRQGYGLREDPKIAVRDRLSAAIHEYFAPLQTISMRNLD